MFLMITTHLAPVAQRQNIKQDKGGMQVFVIMEGGGVVIKLVGHLMGLFSSKCPIQIYFIPLLFLRRSPSA